jgi:hypothetical protein
VKSKRHYRFFVFLAAAASLAGPSTLPAQLADLPLKAGLWETHVITKAGASTIDAGADQACFSAGTTLADYLTATNRGLPGTKCNVSNKVVTAHGISLDTTCTGQSMGSKGHIDFQLPDAEHVSGTSHTTVTGADHGRPVKMAVDKTFTAKFLKPDCGNIKPLIVPNAHAR